jgi:DNA-binding LacI/PurR family transcriptional regulator
MGTSGRCPTLEDVAARSGVSRALVSIVMRDVPGASAETRKRVLGVAAELGYRPDARARLLARSRSRQLGIVFTSYHAYHADLLDGLYRAAGAAGYELILSAQTPSRDEGSAIETLLGYRCDALILLGPDQPARRLAELAARVPVVVVGRRLGTTPAGVVRTSDHHGMRLAVDHLVELGHREIAHVDGGRSPKSADRRRGYRDAMAHHGLADHVRIQPGGQSAEAGAAAARALLESGRLPTAVVCFNDDCAVAVLDGLTRAGVDVPGAVSLVGFDDSRLSRLPYVDLTTVGQDADQQAAIAVERAIALLDGGDEAGLREVVLPPQLVVRGTSAPLSR